MARRRVLLLKAGVWLLGLYPLGRLGWWAAGHGGGLGANPIEKVLHHTGWWALALLLVTLAVTPLRRLTGRNELIKLRRPLGLFAFFWATTHFLVYVGLDQVFGWRYILEDIAERPFITVGFAAWLILVPLAVTSTRGWIRRLGKRWTKLHRLVYLAGPLGVLHFYWRIKADTDVAEPLAFLGVFLLLMMLRIRRRRRSEAARAPRLPRRADAAHLPLRPPLSTGPRTADPPAAESPCSSAAWPASSPS